MSRRGSVMASGLALALMARWLRVSELSGLMRTKCSSRRAVKAGMASTGTGARTWPAARVGAAWGWVVVLEVPAGRMAWAAPGRPSRATPRMTRVMSVAAAATAMSAMTGTRTRPGRVAEIA